MHVKVRKALVKKPDWLEWNMEAEDGHKALTHEKIANSTLNLPSSDIKGAILSRISFPAGKGMLQDQW